MRILRLGGKVPVGPAKNMKEVFDDPHVASREMLGRFSYPGQGDGVVTGSPIRFQGSSSGLYQRSPKNGENATEILAEFGIQRESIGKG